MWCNQETFGRMCKTWALLNGLEIPTDVYIDDVIIRLQIKNKFSFVFNRKVNSSIFFNMLDGRTIPFVSEENLTDIFEKYQDAMKEFQGT